MIGELETRQIVSLSNQGASAEEISGSCGVELELVKLVLARNNAGSDIDRDINDNQLAALRQVAYDLALQTEDINVSCRMVQFLIERDKPRDKKESSPIVAINNALIMARESFSKLQESYEK